MSSAVQATCERPDISRRSALACRPRCAIGVSLAVSFSDSRWGAVFCRNQLASFFFLRRPTPGAFSTRSMAGFCSPVCIDFSLSSGVKSTDSGVRIFCMPSHPDFFSIFETRFVFCIFLLGNNPLGLIVSRFCRYSRPPLRVPWHFWRNLSHLCDALFVAASASAHV